MPKGSLGLDASLATLSEDLPFVIAIRNDSGEPIESMRILFKVNQGGRTFDGLMLHGPLPQGATTLTAPQGLGGASRRFSVPPGSWECIRVARHHA